LTIIPATVKINAPWINEFLRIFHLIKKYGKAPQKNITHIVITDLLINVKQNPVNAEFYALQI